MIPPAVSSTSAIEAETPSESRDERTSAIAPRTLTVQDAVDVTNRAHRVNPRGVRELLREFRVQRPTQVPDQRLVEYVARCDALMPPPASGATAPTTPTAAMPTVSAQAIAAAVASRALPDSPASPARCTVCASNDGPVTKRIGRNSDGTLRVVSDAQIAHGTFRQMSLERIGDLGTIIKALEKNEALTWGVTREPSGRLATVKAIKEGHAPAGAIARSKDHFSWADGPGVLMLDADLKDAPDALRADSVEEVRTRLIGACPGLGAAPMLAMPSAGACIYDDATNEFLRGLTGVRGYVLVERATDIPEIGRRLRDRLVLAGNGFAFISRAGIVHVRAIVDDSVWSPERLDFIGGAICDEGLSQRRGEPQVWNVGAEALSLAQVSPLSEAEATKLREIEASIKAAILPEAQRKRNAWEAMQRAAGRTVSAQWRPDGTIEFLDGDHELLLTDGSWVTIDAIVAEPTRYHEATCADPLEPDYGGGDRRIAKIYTLNQRVGPVIHSNAHGGIRYFLRASAQADFECENASVLAEGTAPASETERVAALHGFPTRAFFLALPTIDDGALVAQWNALQQTARRGDPLWGVFRRVVLRHARGLRTFADEPNRFSVLLEAELASDGEWTALHIHDRALLLRAAHVFIVDLNVLAGSLDDSPGAPLSLTPTLREQLVEGLLFAKSPAGIVGAPGKGKSWVALELAARVAKSPALDSMTADVVPETFAGRRVKHGDVFYFASEGVDGLRTRVAKWEATYGELTRLFLFDRVPPLSDLDRAIAFILDAVAKAAVSAPPALIVIDVLRAAVSGDENLAHVMGPVAKTVEILARMTGATVLLVHHSPKADPKDARGSTALPAALDLVAAVTKSGDEITLEVTKGKDVPDDQCFRWRLRPDGVLVDGRDVTAAQSSTAAAQEPDELIVARAIHAIAQPGTWVTKKELNDELAAQHPAHFGKEGNKKGTVGSRRSRAIKAALQERWLTVKGSDKSSRYTIGAETPGGLISVGNLEEILK
jgi:hypothetical protein